MGDGGHVWSRCDCPLENGTHLLIEDMLWMEPSMPVELSAILAQIALIVSVVYVYLSFSRQLCCSRLSCDRRQDPAGPSGELDFIRQARDVSADHISQSVPVHLTSSMLEHTSLLARQHGASVARAGRFFCATLSELCYAAREISRFLSKT